MCSGTTWDGKLHIAESEIQARCSADTSCAGYGRYDSNPGYFRPVTYIEHVAWDTTWETYAKFCQACSFDSVIARTSQGDNGWSQDGKITGTRLGITECRAFCNSRGASFIQVHAGGHCGCFSTCDLTRPSGDFADPATTYACSAEVVTYVLASAGSHECPAGQATVSQGECQQAVATLAMAAGRVPGRDMQVGSGGACLDGSWGEVPLGCSAQSGKDWAAHFKTSGATGEGCVHAIYQLVCTAASTPSAGGAGAGASAVGDPHLQNIHGERFDLMKAGKHVLINIPRGTAADNALLRVQADARRLGGQCADMYFQQLNVTGSWAEAKQAGGYHYSVSQHDAKAPEWVAFGKVELKVVHGRTDSGLLYLNLYVKHLGRAGFAVGGLLGEDDHGDASAAPDSCAQRLALVLPP